MISCVSKSVRSASAAALVALLVSCSPTRGVTANASARCRDTSSGSAIEPAVLLDIESPTGVDPRGVIDGVYRRLDGQRVCDFEYDVADLPSGGVDGSGYIACGTADSTTTASRVAFAYEAYGAPASIYELQSTWVALRADGIVGDHFCDIDVVDLRK